VPLSAISLPMVECLIDNAPGALARAQFSIFAPVRSPAAPQ
jgi:hypothetical protein